MRFPTAVLNGAADRLNPIVVKELRQAVRSRFVSAVLMLFMGIQALVVGIFVMSMVGRKSAGLAIGGDICMTLFTILTFACFYFIPLYTGMRFSYERSDIQKDLLFTTTITPGAVVRGKMWSAAILTVLLYSATAPFMTFSYLLRGVDLMTTFVILGTEFLIIMAVTQLTVFLAAIPAHRVVKLLLGVALFLSLTGMILGFFEGLFHGNPFSGIPLMWGGLAVLGTLLTFLLAAMGLIHFAAVAILAPPSANRSLPLRIYTVSAWLGLGLVTALWWWIKSQVEPLVICGIFGIFFFSFSFLVAVSERQSWGPRLRRTIPRFLPARVIAFLFYSGAAGGILGVVLMLGLFFGVLAVLIPLNTSASPQSNAEGWNDILCIALYAFSYCMTALLLRNGFLSGRRVHLPHYFVWLFALALHLAGVLIPYAIRFIVFRADFEALGDDGAWAATNPWMLTASHPWPHRLLFVSIWAAVVALASVPWFVRQFRAFRPLEETPVPAADDGGLHG